MALPRRFLLIGLCFASSSLYYFFYVFHISGEGQYESSAEDSGRASMMREDHTTITNTHPLAIASTNLTPKARILLFTQSIRINRVPSSACDVFQIPKDLLYYLRQNHLSTLPKKRKHSKDPRLERIQAFIRKHDVVLFHALDLPVPEIMNKLSREREPFQKFAIYTKESPYNVPSLSKKHQDGIFDWMVTYKRDGHVFAPYGRYRELEQQRALNISFLLSDSRDKLGVWIVSHCGELRDQFVRKLQRYIPVDVFGKCSRFFEQPMAVCKRSSEECETLLHRYKFALAFENSFCRDYVTEKYWDALVRGSIPVVLGGSDYNKKIAIPGSFINARDFNSSEDLAMYLIALAGNEREYLKYHLWRSKYELDYDTRDAQRLEYVLQDLCDLATTEGANSTRYELSKYYSAHSDCEYQFLLKRQRFFVW